MPMILLGPLQELNFSRDQPVQALLPVRHTIWFGTMRRLGTMHLRQLPPMTTVSPRLPLGGQPHNYSGGGFNHQSAHVIFMFAARPT